MCLARPTPHTGSSGAQGLWSEFAAKPQLAAPKGSTGPCLQGAILFPLAMVKISFCQPQSVTYSAKRLD